MVREFLTFFFENWKLPLTVEDLLNLTIQVCLELLLILESESFVPSI